VAAVECVQRKGKICVLDMDVQGVQNVKKSSFQLNPHFIFVAPPSFAALKARLRGRGTESEDDIQTRLNQASNELTYGKGAGNFDFYLVNDDLEVAFRTLVSKIQEWYPKLQDAKDDSAFFSTYCKTYCAVM
jgi:guanylate kinase